jgi:hypothetical protein
MALGSVQFSSILGYSFRCSTSVTLNFICYFGGYRSHFGMAQECLLCQTYSFEFLLDEVSLFCFITRTQCILRAPAFYVSSFSLLDYSN